MEVGKGREHDHMDVGGRTPTVGALGDVWNSCRGAEAYPLEGCVPSEIKR